MSNLDDQMALVVINHLKSVPMSERQRWRIERTLMSDPNLPHAVRRWAWVGRQERWSFYASIVQVISLFISVAALIIALAVG